MKRTTKLLSVIISTVMVIQIFVINGIIANASTSGFTATQATNNGNYVHLSWSGDSGSKYMVEKKGQSDSDYQTISLKTSIKVLNIYPSLGDGLQSWMSTYGNPSGTDNTMTVDKVTLSIFNTQYATYLANNYDVLYFGAYDSNNSQDLSADAELAVETFIKSGGGCVLGHDTASGTHTQFITLAQKYLNMRVKNESVAIPTYGSTQVVLSKKGLLMNYPYSLGNVGDILTTPNSHTYYEFAGGDVWFKYASDTWSTPSHNSEVNTYNDGTTYTGTNNFYLTTWNNVAMIQTGHSNGSATVDEQKITANLLYYLAQVSTSTSYDDHSAQDLAAPNAVSGSVSNVYVNSDGKTSITFPSATDNGSTYNYKLYTMSTQDGSKPTTESAATSTTVTTGIKGYAVKISQTSGTDDPGTTVNTTSLNYTTSSKLTPGTYYAHIRAIDNADNVSNESIIQFKVPVSTYNVTSSVVIGRNTSVTSNVNGTVYIVPKKASNYTTKTALDAVSGKVTSSCTANTACTINTSKLSVGEYQIYTVDESGNVSAANILNIIPLLDIISKDSGSNVTANGDLKASINMPELNDTNVGNVTVKLVVDPVSSTTQQHANIAIAASELKNSGKNIVAAYDISMFKTVLDNSGSKLSSGKVSNSDITGAITLLIPVPRQYIGKTDVNLNIVYIDDNGNITPLTTTVVTIDGVKYLQFTTTHFSVYAVVSEPKASSPKTGDSNQFSIEIQMLVIATAGCGLVVIRIWKKRNTASLSEI